MFFKCDGDKVGDRVTRWQLTLILILLIDPHRTVPTGETKLPKCAIQTSLQIAPLSSVQLTSGVAPVDIASAVI